PVTRCGNAMNQAAVMQHGQIETRAVPADQSRRVAFDGFKELADQRGLGIVRLAQGLDAKTLVVPKNATDDADALQMQRQKVVPDGVAARLKGTLGDLGVGHICAPAVELAQPVHVGQRFQIKDECRCHRAGRYSNGSSGVPWRRISKCRRGEVVSVWPISAILAPRLTASPVLASNVWL